MTELSCIYCLERKTPDQFNREHVVPEAFGSFENNLVLHREVCRDCNHYFGTTLDHLLSRGSPPGIMRYLTGKKPLAELDKASPARVKTHLDTSDPLAADELEFVQTDAGEGPRLTAGLRYWSVTRNSWQFISLRKLEGKENGLLNDLDRSQLVMAVYSGEEELERLRKALHQLKLSIAISPKATWELQPGERVRVAFDVIEDDTTRRAIAKIAFNYLTKMQGAAFALNEGFNLIRRYIRFGEYSDRKFVRRISKVPLHEGGEETRQRGGHHVQVDLALSGTGVIGWVTLFQILPYRISFGSYTGVLPARLASGHYFDVQTKKIIEVQAITKPPNLLLPRIYQVKRRRT